MVEYIQDFVNMLAQFSWIYEEQNTDILLTDVLEKIPEEWIIALFILPWTELKQIPFGLIKDDWPSSLKFFIRQCNSLGKFRFSIPALQANENSDNETKYINKNIPLKKQIEINAMSPLIYEVCQNVQSCTVLDVGSGMGYLDEVLHHRFGLQCIGLDSEPKYTTGGRHRLKEDSCIKLMLHETVMVENSEACCEKLKILLQTARNLDSTCDCRLMQHSSSSNLDLS